MLLVRLDMRWGIGQRLAFIETQLFWEGGVNRADLVATFAISVPQASKDLALYQQQAGGNLRYDAGRKRYLIADTFTPRFAAIDPDAYLAGLAEADGSSATPRPPFGAVVAERLPVPHRPIVAEVLRLLVAAVREERSVEVRYQSMVADRVGARWRTLSPHAFAFDGTRWHVRAFADDRGRFLDFIVSRCLEVRLLGPAQRHRGEDDAWQSYVDVVLAPNPALSAEQRAVVADDYGMRDDRVVVPVRRALLPYFNKRLRFDLAGPDNPRDAGVIVQNRAEYEAALRGSEPKPD